MCVCVIYVVPCVHSYKLCSKMSSTSMRVHYIFLWRLFSHQCQWLLWIVSHAWKDPQVFDGHSYLIWRKHCVYSSPFGTNHIQNKSKQQIIHHKIFPVSCHYNYQFQCHIVTIYREILITSKGPLEYSPLLSVTLINRNILIFTIFDFSIFDFSIFNCTNIN